MEVYECAFPAHLNGQPFPVVAAFVYEAFHCVLIGTALDSIWEPGPGEVNLAPFEQVGGRSLCCMLHVVSAHAAAVQLWLSTGLKHGCEQQATWVVAWHLSPLGRRSTRRTKRCHQLKACRLLSLPLCKILPCSSCTLLCVWGNRCGSTIHLNRASVSSIHHQALSTVFCWLCSIAALAMQLLILTAAA